MTNSFKDISTQLCVDIGNTRTKFALFNGQTLLFKEAGDIDLLKELIATNTIFSAIISSVNKGEEIGEELSKNKIKTISLNHLTSIPITNKYKTPKTLGDDRLANAIAANAMFTGQNVLAIDCGTCIKFDFLTAQKEYLGGAISPGLQLRFNALHQGTAQLPHYKPKSIQYLIGENSQESIMSGVMNGALAEINGIIERYHHVYENLTVILTGGDAKYFEKELKYNIFAEPNLTLIGLNEILLHQK